jgi:hypothetical protein
MTQDISATDQPRRDHWKHRATRCAVEGCDRTRVKGWSTCALMAHKPLGQSLYGAGRIDPIPAPAVQAGQGEIPL